MKTERSVIVFVIILCNFYGSRSSGFGKCPKYGYMENFDIKRFTGQWYEIERSFHLMELISGCTTIDMNINSKNNVEVNVKTFGRISGKKKISEGIAMQSKKDPSIFNYKVNGILPNNIAPGSGYYQVLDTDYVNYAIIWKCTGFGLLYTDNIWVLGRNKEISVTKRAHIYDFLHSKSIDTDRLIIPKMNNCTQNFFR